MSTTRPTSNTWEKPQTRYWLDVLSAKSTGEYYFPGVGTVGQRSAHHEPIQCVCLHEYSPDRESFPILQPGLSTNEGMILE